MGTFRVPLFLLLLAVSAVAWARSFQVVAWRVSFLSFVKTVFFDITLTVGQTMFVCVAFGLGAKSLKPTLAVDVVLAHQRMSLVALDRPMHSLSPDG